MTEGIFSVFRRVCSRMLCPISSNERRVLGEIEKFMEGLYLHFAVSSIPFGSMPLC